MQEYRMLIVDDDLSWQSNFQEIVESLNTAPVDGDQYIAWVAGSYHEAEDQLNRRHFHLALIDLRLRSETKELEGKKLVQKIKELNEGTNTIVITGYADPTITTELLKQLDAFYLFEKGKPLTSLVEQIKNAIWQAQDEYQVRFNSAMDFLRGSQDIHSWAAEALQALLGSSRVSRIDDLGNLRKLLDNLLENLYPLLYHREDGGAIIDSKGGMVCARCWSKALSGPVYIKFAQQDRLNPEMGDADTNSIASVQRVFTKIVRTQTVEEFSGVVYAPIQPPFEEFLSDTQ
jgi:ActR/RegA family two-component response regulator